MRKYLIPILAFFFLATPVLANYVFNPFTQKLDRTMYGENALFLTTTSTQFCLASSTCITSWASVGGSYVRNSYSSRFSELVNVTNTTDALDQIFKFTYVAPSISLVSYPTASVREFGNNQNSIILDATTVKASNDITEVKFYRGATLIYTESSPHPLGGLQTYTETTPITETTSFTAKVGDGTSTITSNTITYTFCYPIFVGVGSPALDETGIKALTKLVKTKSNTVDISNPVNQVFYYSAPQSYGLLTSILDTNSFEVLSDYVVRNETFTMLDGSSVAYYVYEFANVTSQVNFQNTYKY